LAEDRDRTDAFEYGELTVAGADAILGEARAMEQRQVLG
jgi:hypothetical protein